MRFRKYLKEKADNQHIFLKKEFVKSIENYIFKNDPKYLKIVIKNNSKIPPMFKTGGVVYRGMFLSDDDIDKIKKNKFILNNFSSWSTDEKMASRFITDKSKITKGSKGNKVLLKKNVQSKDVVIDIYQYILYLSSTDLIDDFDELNKEMAFEEKEKILNKGIKITEKDIYKIL